MKLQSKVFLTGPNIHGSDSGMVARLALEPADAASVDWRPTLQTMNAWMNVIRMGFPMTPMAALARTPEQIAAAASPFCELAFTLFDYFTQNVTVRRGFGRIIAREPDALTLFFPCEDQAVGEVAVSFAGVLAATMASRGDAPAPLPPAARERFAKLQKSLASVAPSPFELELARAAAARDIPWQRLGRQTSVLLLGQGCAGRRLVGGRLDETGRLAADNHATMLVLLSLMLPTPEWRVFSSPDLALRTARTLEYPILVRPRSGDGGVEVDNEAALTAALAAFPGKAILEAVVPGQDVTLRIEGGRYAGEEAVHPDNARLAEIAARACGLKDAGVVYRAVDPATSWREAKGVFRQVRPLAPLAPPPAPAFELTPGAMLKTLFPPGDDGRIPTYGVTGSVGKSTTCGMVAAILARTGLIVARTATQGVWIGPDRIAIGDKAGGRRAAGLLFDPAVQAGVFELSRGGLIKRGMTLDAIDVGAVLNVQDNHLGLDGMETREHLAAVKSLVVRHARKLAVLNADDPLCLKMREVVTAERLCLISTAPENAALDAHAAAGGLTGRLHQVEGRDALAEIRLFEGAALIGSIAATEVPASMEGRFLPPLISGLYAAAMTYGMGVDFSTIREALSGFKSDAETNPNRMNVIEGLPFKLWITWADGPAAFAALARAAGKTPAARKTMMISMMGDRQESFVRDTVAAAVNSGAFDDFICSDAVILRDRPPGEMAQRLAQALRQSGVSEDRILVTSDHTAASAAALERIRADDLLLVVTHRDGTARIVREAERFRV